MLTVDRYISQLKALEKCLPFRWQLTCTEVGHWALIDGNGVSYGAYSTPFEAFRAFLDRE